MTNFPKHLLPDWEGKVILGGRRGSFINKTNITGSDEDFFAVWVHPPSHYYGIQTLPGSPRRYRELQYQKQEGILDLLTVDLPIYIQYLAHKTPDYTKWLWASPHISILRPGGTVLLDSRYQLASRDLATAFWMTGLGLFNRGLYARALVHFWDADSLFTTQTLEASTFPYSSVIRTSKITGNTDDIQAYCQEIVNYKLPTWKGPDTNYTRERFNNLAKFAMVHAWNLSLAGVNAK